MKHIIKGNEPVAWKAYRETPGVDFDAIPELKEALLKEQGYLCCYCMARISNNNMRTEHFLPRKYKNEIFRYSNLLAACSGDSSGNRHCDVSKGENEILINPISKVDNCESIICYHLNGKVSCPDKYKNDMEVHLNLNNPVIVSNRIGAMDGALQMMKKKNYKQNEIKKLIDFFYSKHNGMYYPYSNSVIWLLNKKLKAN